jgi:hypothetical protein
MIEVENKMLPYQLKCVKLNKPGDKKANKTMEGQAIFVNNVKIEPS